MTLLRPEWLWAFLPLAAAAWWLWTRRAGLGAWERATDPGLMDAMVLLGHVETGQRGRTIGIGLCVVGLVILALSGPAVERRDTPSFRNLDGVLFVVDASTSMTDDPRWPQMLTMGRFGLASLGSRPAGLIVYAGDAYVAAGMTHDHLQLGQTLSLVDGETVPDLGSRPGLGLGLAASLLQRAEVIAGDVVLFTDGAGLGPETLARAERIALLGSRLSVVTPTPVGPTTDLAQVGQGRVFDLTQTDALGEWLAEDSRRRLERQDLPLLFWHDLGPYLLFLALLPLCLMFRRDAV